MLLFFALVFGLIPGFAWLVFYLSEDPHPEPNRMILLTFFAGISFGFCTIIIEQIFTNALDHWNIAELSLVSLAGLALIEEVMKFSAAYFAVGKTKDLDEPVDRMIYMVVAALGFATLENIGAISNIPSNAALLPLVFQTDLLRFVGATLLHTLTSAVIGYHWAVGAASGKVGRNLVLGFAIATVLHTLFNYLILYYGNIAYTVVFLVIVGFFVLNDFEKLKAKPK